MNRRLGLGLLSLIGTMSLACGGEKTNSNSSSAGAGGSSMDGGAGSGAAGTTTTTTTTTPATAFTGIATCSGCVEVEVPVSNGNSEENVLDQIGFPFFLDEPGLDLSNAVVTWRVMALENNPDLMVAPYAENGEPYPGAYRAQVALSAANFPPNTWVDVRFDLSAHPALGEDAGVAGGTSSVDAGPAVTVTPVVDAGAVFGDAGLVADAGVLSDASVATNSDTAATPEGIDLSASFLPIDPAFDKSGVTQLGLYVGAGPDLVGDAVARVAIDSVTYTGVTDIPDVTFDMGVQGFTRNDYNAPPGTEGPLYHP